MTNKKFLIVLSNGDDLDLILTNPEAEAWITADFDLAHSRDRHYREPIPQSLLDAFPDEDRLETTVDVTIGSFENDRALACPGVGFNCVSGLLAYVREHDIEVTDEFIGCIY